ncbi:hypothetical protein D9M72_622880 [compost metagenome]
MAWFSRALKRLLESEVSERRTCLPIAEGSADIAVVECDIQLAAVRMGKVRQQRKAVEERKVAIERQCRRSGEGPVHVS